MKLERHDDKKLLTSIGRSYWSINFERRREGLVTTKLFTFEKLDCKNFDFHWSETTCVKVTVLSTGQSYIATHGFSFGTSTWGLWKVIE